MKIIKRTSHPVRVRGLKQISRETEQSCEKSHPVRVRGLKRMHSPQAHLLHRRTPCGCVG